jgi:hypothetical protein
MLHHAAQGCNEARDQHLLVPRLKVVGYKRWREQ